MNVDTERADRMYLIDVSESKMRSWLRPSHLYVESDDVEMDVLVFVLVFTVVDDSVLLVDNSVLVVDDSVLVVDDSELETDEFTSVLVSSPKWSTIVVIDSSKVSWSQSSVLQSSTNADWALPAPIMTLTPTATTASVIHASRMLGIRSMCMYLVDDLFLIRVLLKNTSEVRLEEAERSRDCVLLHFVNIHGRLILIRPLLVVLVDFSVTVERDGCTVLFAVLNAGLVLVDFVVDVRVVLGIGLVGRNGPGERGEHSYCD